MIATADRPVTAVMSVPLPAPWGEAARALALAFLRYASACWRGEASAQQFATRLGAYWRPSLPPMPSTPPHAFSPHGAGGYGIAWYQRGDDVLGYIPACAAGYHVPIAAISRLLQCVSAGGYEPHQSASDQFATGLSGGDGARGRVICCAVHRNA